MSETKKALLISIALHGALLLALASLRPHFDLGTGADRKYVEVALVAALGTLESRTASTDSRSATETEAETVPETAAGSGPERASGNAINDDVENGIADPVDRESAPAPPVPEIADERSPDEPVPARTVPDEPVAGVETSDATIAEAQAARREPVTETPAPREPVTETPTPLEPQPPESIAYEPMTTAETQLIEKRIGRWARSFAALGEWDTATTWSDRKGEYAAEVTHFPAGDGSGYDEAVVTVTTERDGRKFSTELRMQRLGFSHYAQFIDHWDPQVQIHDDQIDGRFHSNSDIYVDRAGGVQPTFLGKVTTASKINTSRSDRSIRRSQVFLGGLEERVGRIPLPKTVALSSEELDAEQLVLLDTDTRIRFLADGTITWSPLDAPERRRSTRIDDDTPLYIVANEDAAVYLAGTVNGRVLVYTQDDIVIESDLLYAQHPLADPSSDDYLGLVAEGSVDVARPSITGPGDLEIHAAIYARRRFAVRSYGSRKAGTLTIVGSLTAGSVTATEPRFATSLKFDARLAETRPPQFPVTDRFEIAEWDGRWSVAQD